MDGCFGWLPFDCFTLLRCCPFLHFLQYCCGKGGGVVPKGLPTDSFIAFFRLPYLISPRCWLFLFFFPSLFRISISHFSILTYLLLLFLFLFFIFSYSYIFFTLPYLISSGQLFLFLFFFYLIFHFYSNFYFFRLPYLISPCRLFLILFLLVFYFLISYFSFLPIWYHSGISFLKWKSCYLFVASRCEAQSQKRGGFMEEIHLGPSSLLALYVFCLQWAWLQNGVKSKSYFCSQYI